MLASVLFVPVCLEIIFWRKVGKVQGIREYFWRNESIPFFAAEVSFTIIFSFLGELFNPRVGDSFRVRFNFYSIGYTYVLYTMDRLYYAIIVLQ